MIIAIITASTMNSLHALPMDAVGTGALLRLMTWLSPSFPVGAFAYSHGIEAALEAECVSDEASLETYIRTAIAHGAGAVDAALFVGTWRAVRARDADQFYLFLDRAAAMRGAAELAAETALQGAAFWKTVLEASPAAAYDWADSQIAGFEGSLSYPCAIAAAASSAGIPLSAGLNAYLHAFAANLVSAGVRLIPLGQTAGQRIIAHLSDTIESAAAHAVETPFEDVGTSAFLLDIFSMNHETQYTRLFRS
jgi:urease accessory protein